MEVVDPYFIEWKRENSVKNLSELFKQEIQKYLKKGDREAVDILKGLLGEFQRQPKKDLTIDEEIRILKQLEKKELELLDIIDSRGKSRYLRIVRSYIPSLVSTDEICSWITTNVDFSTLKNPMQAVGIVMKEFGARADGRIVKDIVMRISEAGK